MFSTCVILLLLMQVELSGLYAQSEQQLWMCALSLPDFH